MGVDYVAIRATVSYDGTDFAGFQRQPNARSVQGELESALSGLYGHPVTVRGAGRTDAGVHAKGQVIAFVAPATVPPEKVAIVLGGWLPADVALRDSEVTTTEFNPRRHAVRRTYRYGFVQDRCRDPLRDRFTTRLWPGLNVAAMEEAAQLLLGDHDFRSFCTVGDEDESGTTRTLGSVRFETHGAFTTVEWQARSFLRKQVRCMMGALFAVGRGKFAPQVVGEMLAGQAWPPQMAVAPPQGLVFERVDY